MTETEATQPPKRKRGRPRKNPAPPAEPPPNTDAMTEDQKTALRFHHKKKITTAQKAKERAVADLRNCRKQAKADCGDEGLKEIDVAIKMDSPEGEALARAEVDRLIRVAKWMGADIGQQLELMDTVPQRDWYEDGKRAGLAGETGKPPEGLVQEDGQKWLTGWQAGQKVLLDDFGKKSAAANGTNGQDDDDRDLRPSHLRNDEGRQQDGGPAIGTEPPTHTVQE